MDKEIEQVLEYGILAPSSHNSQPWQLSVSGADISVTPDPRRRLEESDKNDRQLFISLGCLTENVRQAANAFGYDTDCEIGSQGVVRISLTKDHSIKIKQNSLKNIRNRVTNRNHYENDDQTLDLIEYVNTLNTPDINLYVSGSIQKNKLAEVAIKASVEAMRDDKFRRELSNYVKNNITKSKVGMPAYGMGIPTPISFLAPALLKYVNVNLLSAKKDLKTLQKYTPYLVVITTTKDTPTDWIKTGLVYQKVALKAEELSLNTAMWASPIQIGSFYKDLQKILKTKMRPQAFFRIGKAIKQTKASPRLPLSSVLK